MLYVNYRGKNVRDVEEDPHLQLYKVVNVHRLTLLSVFQKMNLLINLNLKTMMKMMMILHLAHFNKEKLILS